MGKGNSLTLPLRVEDDPGSAPRYSGGRVPAATADGDRSGAAFLRRHRL